MMKVQNDVQKFGIENFKDTTHFSVVDLGKGAKTAFFATATVVAKAFQSSKEKFTELKDAVNGIGSTSQKPYNFVAVESPVEKTTLPVTEEEESVPEDVSENEVVVVEDENKSENRRLARAAIADIYKDDIDNLIDSQLQPKYKNAEDEESFVNSVSDISQKLENFINEDEKIKANFIKGDKVDLQARKAEFNQLINDYNDQVKKRS